MSFSTSSYFAGVATVFVATAVGFSGGLMLTKDSKTPPMTRVERVASSEPLPASGTSSSNAASAEAGATDVKIVEITRAAAANPVSSSTEVKTTPVSPQNASAEPVKFVAGSEDKDNDDDASVATPLQPASPASSLPAQPRDNAVQRRDNSVQNVQSPKMKRSAAKRKTEQVAIRKQHDLDTAVEAVRQIPRDSNRRDVAQGAPETVSGGSSPFGFFGGN